MRNPSDRDTIRSHPTTSIAAEEATALAKQWHEIRDPVHVFIRLETPERKILDSSFFQRLRHVHQLALTNLVYPAATHTRFEHSLGVMDLASRVFDIVTSPDNLSHESVRGLVPKQGSHDLTYWRRAVRMAALCHDLGHLPFSHAAEEKLLPEGWRHEHITGEIIHEKGLADIWKELHLDPVDVAKLAVGPKYWKGDPFSDLEAILCEIIQGDALGVDRIDYLLRDSLHAGVSYGRFDHYRLVETLRILPKEEGSDEPALGIEDGGIYSAEALVLARYFMYSQLYFHPVRRIYDIHLQEFLVDWLPGGTFPVSPTELLPYSDVEVYSAIRRAADDPAAKGHDPASRIVHRKHFKLLYTRNPADLVVNRDAAAAIYDAALQEFGPDSVRIDRYPGKGGSHHFPVLTRDGRIASSLDLSPTLKTTPPFAVDYVFIRPDLLVKGQTWLAKCRQEIISHPGERKDEQAS